MLGIIITAAIIWFVCKVASAAFENAKEERRQKQIMRIQEEQERHAEAIRVQRAEARALYTKQLELEREQFRQRKELERHKREIEKNRAEIQKNSYRLDKAEDEIAHFVTLLGTLNLQRETMQAELDEITNKLYRIENELDPLEASKNKEYWGAEGAILYQEHYAEALEDKGRGKRKTDAETNRMRKRKETLDNKLITLDNKIFATEQRIKKAEYDKFTAQEKLREVA